MKRDVEEWPNVRTDWSRVRVLEVVHTRHDQYEGVTIQALAAMTGEHPLDAFLDLALDEGLETAFWIPPRNAEEDLQARAQLLKDPYTHISVSDGGPIPGSSPCPPGLWNGSRSGSVTGRS